MKATRQRFLPTAAAILIAGLAGPTAAAEPDFSAENDIVYSEVDGKKLVMHAFLPRAAKKPAPAMVHIHGGWWTGGRATRSPRSGRLREMFRRGIAVFSIEYRLGKNGGFPENIRDCRNAVRFVRKNAKRFNIDPERIGCYGTSAGGHLTMMVAMVPEDFKDGGPTKGLEDVSAKVCCGFSVVGPTDFVRQWDESIDKKPNNARPYHRVLFHGITPEDEAGKKHYMYMSPLGHVRKDVAPLLICDGERDPIVPGLHGKVLQAKLKAVGADSKYWMTVNGGHGWPGGKGFAKVLDTFLKHVFNLGG
jgi:acetyl esterase/lipase